MFKKFLSLILGLSISLSLVTGVSSAENNDNDFILPPDVVKMMELQTEALEAGSVLRSIFTINDDGSETYPDDFAGAWIDAPYFHIALTSNNPQTLNKYEELLKDFDCVVYETEGFTYSLNELDKIRDNVFNNMRKDSSIIGHSVDVKSNKINLFSRTVNYHKPQLLINLF